MKYLRTIITVVLLVANVGFSQFDLNLSYGFFSDDNIYRAPDPTNDTMSSFRLRAGYGFKDIGLHLFNRFNFLEYKENDYKNYLANTIGFSEKIELSENSLSNLYFGGNWNIRKNQSDFNYYDYSQLSGYANSQIFTDVVLLKAGYSYRWRDYENWSELSNEIHYGFLQLNKSFPTKTTLILETAISNKSFSGTDTVTTTSITGGKGNGHRSGGTTNTITTEVLKDLNTSQMHLSFRVTQALGEKIGIYAQYFIQRSIDDKSAYSNFSEFYEDDELFDDPYTYESNEVSTQLTWLMPHSIKLVMNGSYSQKDYIGELAYVDINDSIGTGGLRSDNQLHYFITLSKIFNLKKEWIKSVKFNLNFSIVNNESNSYWYNYDRTAFGGSIEFIL